MALRVDESKGSVLLRYRETFCSLCILVRTLLEHGGTCCTAEEIAFALVVGIHFCLGRFLYIHHHGGHNCTLDHGVDRTRSTVVFGILSWFFFELRWATRAAEVISATFVVCEQLVFGRLFDVGHMALVHRALNFAFGLSEGKSSNRNSNDSEESSLHVSIVTHEWGKRYFLTSITMPIVLRLLHTNDFHGRFTVSQAEKLKTLRQEYDALWLDSGDAIKTGNLGVPLRPEPIWDLFALGGCSVGTLGNRESHVLAAAFRAKIAGAQHTLICANLRDRKGEHVLQPSHMVEHSGSRIGFVGAMVPMVTARMKTQAASAYLWDPPIPAVCEEARRLRQDVDVLIAITHIGLTQDRALAEACPELDVILGGHSHSVLEQPVQLGSVWIAQGGSHGRFVGVYGYDLQSRRLEGGLEPLI